MSLNGTRRTLSACLSDDIGHEGLVNDKDCMESSPTQVVTQDKLGLIQVNIIVVGCLDSTMFLTNYDCPPMFLPIVGRAHVEISEYHLATSFGLELHSIVVSRG